MERADRGSIMPNTTIDILPGTLRGHALDRFLDTLLDRGISRYPAIYVLVPLDPFPHGIFL